VKSLLLKQKGYGKMILWQNNFKLKFVERWTFKVSFNDFAIKLFCPFCFGFGSSALGTERLASWDSRSHDYKPALKFIHSCALQEKKLCN
jgi:hypothetical protein